MGLLEQQNLLARLYTDRPFRESFFADPSGVGRECGLSDPEISETDEIRKEAETFAEALFRKRLREVQKLLPLTMGVAGSDFNSKFRIFASTYNPKSIRAHLEDALSFCGILREDTSVHPVMRDAAAYEAAKLRFFAFERRVTYCFVNYDFRVSQLHPERPPVRTRPRFAIWLRLKGRHRHYLL